MNHTFFQQLKILVIKTAISFVVFIDFLEDLPQKTFKYTIKIGIFSFGVVFFLSFLVIESQKKDIYNLVAHAFIPDYQTIPLDISNRYPIKKDEISLPQISARSVVIVDYNTGKILYDVNSQTPLPPASTTKLMTALVAKDIYNLDQKIAIPEVCTELDTQKVGFEVGEVVVVKDLIYSLLVSSAGDSACALSYGSGSYLKFIELMNSKASSLGLKETSFSNPVGLDDVNNNHVSSAYDLYLLSHEVSSDDFLSNVIRTKEFDMTSGIYKRKIFNTNDLLWDIPGSVGVKTGRTYGAGEVLSYAYKKDNVHLLIVVMGSLDRFEDTKKLLDWTINSYDFGK